MFRVGLCDGGGSLSARCGGCEGSDIKILTGVDFSESSFMPRWLGGRVGAGGRWCLLVSSKIKLKVFDFDVGGVRVRV